MSNRIYGVEVYEALDKLVEINVNTGIVIWKERVGNARFNTKFAGKDAGCFKKNENGIYCIISFNFNGKMYRVARSNLIWWKYTGRLPFGVIDHKNHETSNDSIRQLRDVTDKENSMNVKKSVNRILPMGVYEYEYKGKIPKKKRYRAAVMYCGKCVRFGTYDTVEEAEAVVKQKRKELGFHDNHGS